MRYAISSFVLCLFFVLPLTGQERARVYTVEEIPNVYEQDSTQFVSDPEGYFTNSEVATLNQNLDELCAHTGVQVAMVVVPAVPNDDEVRFTTALFEKWGIGNKESDSGLLILFVTDPTSRVVRFEVGYGLEGIITDYVSDRYIRSYIVPAVLNGESAEGFIVAINELERLLKEQYQVPISSDSEYDEGKGFSSMILIWFAISLLYGVIVMLISSLYDKLHPANKVESVEHELNFQSSIIGNLLSLSLILFIPALFILLPYFKIRKKRRDITSLDCPQCHSKGSVQMLTYPNNISYLSHSEAKEAELGSVRHIILSCTDCDYHKKMSISNRESQFSKCPKCGARTFHLKRSMQRDHFYILEEYQCENCGHMEQKKKRNGDSTPLIGGGGALGYPSHGGFGGFGGGGFGGGHFGGGMSGGGGASVRF